MEVSAIRHTTVLDSTRQSSPDEYAQLWWPEPLALEKTSPPATTTSNLLPEGYPFKSNLVKIKPQFLWLRRLAQTFIHFADPRILLEDDRGARNSHPADNRGPSLRRHDHHSTIVAGTRGKWSLSPPRFSPSSMHLSITTPDVQQVPILPSILHAMMHTFA
jgi:hypothetical protein